MHGDRRKSRNLRKPLLRVRAADHCKVGERWKKKVRSGAGHGEPVKQKGHRASPHRVVRGEIRRSRHVRERTGRLMKLWHRSADGKGLFAVVRKEGRWESGFVARREHAEALLSVSRLTAERGGVEPGTCRFTKDRAL